MTREKQIWNEACHRYADGKMRNAFVAAANWADAHPQWIPVEKELPKKDGKYLFYDEVLGHEVSIYYDGVTIMPSITHWMQLPKAPRKEGKE